MQVCCVAPPPRAATRRASAALKLFADPAPAAQHEPVALLAAAAPAPAPGAAAAHAPQQSPASQPFTPSTPRLHFPPPTSRQAEADAADDQSTGARRGADSGCHSGSSEEAESSSLVHAPDACLPIVRLLAVVIAPPSAAARCVQTSAAHRNAPGTLGVLPAVSPSTLRRYGHRIKGMLLEQFDVSLLDLIRARCRGAGGTPERSPCGSPCSAVTCMGVPEARPQRAAAAEFPAAARSGSCCGAACMSDGGMSARSGYTCEPLPALDMLRVLCDVACGIEGLHRRGMLHMDVKAANVLVMVRRCPAHTLCETRATLDAELDSIN